MKLRRIVASAVTVLALACASAAQPVKDIMNIESALARLQSGQPLNTAEMMALGRTPGAIPAFAQALRSSPPSVRELGIGVLIDLGRVMVPPEGIVPERPGPIVVNPEVVDFLVQALTDESPEVRRKACVALAALVPGDMLQGKAGALTAAIERYPGTDGALVLLGKTERSVALAFLDGHPEVGQASAEDLQMVRARLGDHKAEDAVIVNYVSAKDVRAKGMQARRLGYVGTDRAVRLLARDIRSPESYPWMETSRRSLRLHIIEGLHLAYLREPIFWQPFFQPSDDSYYQKIEDWLTGKLGVRWDNPRPPFLYQQTAPKARESRQ